MPRKGIILFIFIMFCLFSCAQEMLDKINTETLFATLGEYNSENNCLLYCGVDADIKKGMILGSSVRLKFFETGKEIILQNNTITPPIGWLDSSHVLLETSNSLDEMRIFGQWKSYLISYNIYNNFIDTLFTNWYSSSNSVGNLIITNKKLFYTISYGSEKMINTYWMEYIFGSGESKIIKKYKTGSFSIMTYQYQPETDEILYIKSVGTKKELFKLSLLNKSEQLITNLSIKNVEETSTLTNGRFIYVERDLPNDNFGKPNWDKVKYYLKSVDLMTNKITEIYSSKNEITKISQYNDKMLLLSIRGELGDNEIKKTYDKRFGNEVSLGFDVTSYIYLLKLKN